MIINEVSDKKAIRDFLQVPRIIYKNDPHWICPLDRDIEAVFNPSKNKFHEHGEISRWVMKDKDGNLAGRVAAFMNHKTAQSFDQPTGGMGFFECINDTESAFILFNAI